MSLMTLFPMTSLATTKVTETKPMMLLTMLAQATTMLAQATRLVTMKVTARATMQGMATAATVV